ncbi:MAG: hypothetical protein U9N34_04080, partial [Candidatus Cloacimonadota bacterium]|nr:hypothetical protein [Candidatus Cloacimonadota bacterium]
MFTSFKDPIRKKVIAIVLLSIFSLALFVLTHVFGVKKYVSNIENKIDNQSAKLEIGNLISKNINKACLETTRILQSNSLKNFEYYKQENAEIIQDIFALLSIFQKGGEYSYKYDLNMEKIDVNSKTISYKKSDNQEIILEAIDLFPKIKIIVNDFND